MIIIFSFRHTNAGYCISELFFHCAIYMVLCQFHSISLLSEFCTENVTLSQGAALQLRLRTRKVQLRHRRILSLKCDSLCVLDKPIIGGRVLIFMHQGNSVGWFNWVRSPLDPVTKILRLYLFIVRKMKALSGFGYSTHDLSFWTCP